MISTRGPPFMASPASPALSLIARDMSYALKSVLTTSPRASLVVRPSEHTGLGNVGIFVNLKGQCTKPHGEPMAADSDWGKLVSGDPPLRLPLRTPSLRDLQWRDTPVRGCTSPLTLQCLCGDPPPDQSAMCNHSCEIATCAGRRHYRQDIPCPPLMVIYTQSTLCGDPELTSHNYDAHMISGADAMDQPTVAPPRPGAASATPTAAWTQSPALPPGALFPVIQPLRDTPFAGPAKGESTA
jgi:hypothetical protein